MTEDLLIDVKDRVATLTLNRPDRLNALSKDMIDAGVAAIEQFATDPEIGCIIVTGSDRGFCAGGDVQMMNEGQGRELTFEERLDRQRQSHRFSALLHSIPKVTIAAINGPAAGAGMAIALSCDLKIMADTAKMMTAFARVGFAGDFGITWPLVRALGEAKAKELLYLSPKLTADEVLALGLVNRVVPAEELMASTQEWATQIANGPQTAYRYMKENVRLAATQDYQTMSDREAWTQLRTGDTADHKEGARAFVEKRAPSFTGK